MIDVAWIGDLLNLLSVLTRPSVLIRLLPDGRPCHEVDVVADLMFNVVENSLHDSCEKLLKAVVRAGISKAIP